MKINNKHIAIISFDMIPYTHSFGSAQRVFYYADNLINNGFKVTVFANKSTNKKYWYGKQPSFQIYHLESLFSKVLSVLKNKQHTTSKKGKPKYRSSLLGILKNISKLFDKIFFNEPNPKVGLFSYLWLRANEKSILNFISNNSIDHIIISMPPFGLSSYSFIKKLHKQFCAVSIDYRDPWNCWNGNKGVPFLKEKKVLRIVDHVFTTNENHKSKLIKDFSISSNKITTVMNGYDSYLWKNIEESDCHEKDPRLTFSFIGSISLKKNSYRNPITFIEAYSHFKNKDDIIVRFVGINTDDPDVRKIKNLYPTIQFIPVVSQYESFLYILKSDVLLNFHIVDNDSSKYLIAGKIFDYYRSKRFILSINSRKSLEHQFVSKHKIGICVENSSEQILYAITTIYDQWRNNGKNLKVDGDFSNLNNYTRDHQNTILSEWYKNN